MSDAPGDVTTRFDSRQLGAASRGPADPARRGRVLRRPRDRRARARRVRAVDDRPRDGHRHRHHRGRGDARRARRVHRARTSRWTRVQGFVMLPPVFSRPPLATERVRFVGDVVAAVVAETRAAGGRRGRVRDRRLRPAAGRRRRRGRARRRRAAAVRGARLQPRDRVRVRRGPRPARRTPRSSCRSASTTSASPRCRWSRTAIVVTHDGDGLALLRPDAGRARRAAGAIARGRRPRRRSRCA